MTLATDRCLTLNQYLAYTHDSDARYELVDGVIAEMAPENPENNTIALIVLAQFLYMGIPVQRLATAHQVQVQSAYVSARQPDLMVHSESSRKAIMTDGLLTLDAPHPYWS
jgi:Uma2 family endonuclease